MRKKQGTQDHGVSRKSPATKRRRAKARQERAAAAQTLRDAKVQSSKPTALRLVSVDADRAHITVNQAVSTATALKIIEVLRQDHAGDD